jgi:DNA-binding NarL/FixJ family response regulator
VENIKILHANSNTLVRAGLKALLKKGGGVDKIWEAEDNDELFEKLQEKQPDLLVMDFDQPGLFHDADVIRVRKEYPDLKVLLISTDEEHSRILALLETGIHGYLTRECDEDEVVSSIFSVAGGEKFYCNKVINIILDKKLAPDVEDNCEPTSLSVRETEITTLIAEGMTNKEIAAKLFLSPHTVNTHRKNIMKKLGVNSASGLIMYAVNAGLVASS